jgi:hypothetical protein
MKKAQKKADKFGAGANVAVVKEITQPIPGESV